MNCTHDQIGEFAAFDFHSSSSHEINRRWKAFKVKQQIQSVKEYTTQSANHVESFSNGPSERQQQCQRSHGYRHYWYSLDALLTVLPKHLWKICVWSRNDSRHPVEYKSPTTAAQTAEQKLIEQRRIAANNRSFPYNYISSDEGFKFTHLPDKSEPKATGPIQLNAFMQTEPYLVVEGEIMSSILRCLAKCSALWNEHQSEMCWEAQCSIRILH